MPHNLPRRRFLKALVATLPAASLASAALTNLAAESAPDNLPPIRALTRGPKHHWRGYYDKLLCDPTNRFVLANEVDFEHRSPRPDDVLRVGMIDTQDGDKWIELGTTRAWNWQQGCMLQWLPGSASEVVWNDREGDRFVCRILNVRTGHQRTLPNPIYCLSPDGRWALAPDFRRLNDTRPGYGYAGLPDPHQDVLAPDQAGLWRMDLQTGKQELLFSFADAVKVPHPAGYPARAKHWFNHLLFSTDGRRFVFLHRWRGAEEPKGRFSTRMFSMDADGREPFVLIPHGKVSHFVWRDAQHVTAYAWYPPANDWRFCVFQDRSEQVEVIGENILRGDGHITYVAGTQDQWALNDTYPDQQRLQHPHLFHLPTKRRVPLDHCLSPPEYQGEWRCDLHPGSSRDGRYVLFDSPHGGQGRQVYLVDISQLVGR